MRVASVIPARFNSSRFPGKPLAKIHGKPMIEWVYRATSSASKVDQTLVATDDQRIFEAVKEFGGEVVMTSPDLKSGTDRVAAVAAKIPAEIFINVQGDEPLMDPRAIDRLVELMEQFEMATLMTRLTDQQEMNDPNVVKVRAEGNRAVEFSRNPISGGLRHLGLYGFRRQTLIQFSQWPPAEAEKEQRLEQLRAQAHGIEIGIAQVDYRAIGVDCPEDLDKVQALLVERTHE